MKTTRQIPRTINPNPRPWSPPTIPVKIEPTKEIKVPATLPSGEIPDQKYNKPSKQSNRNK